MSLRFYPSFVFLEIRRVFFGNRLRELVSLVEQIICDRFAKNEPVNENWVASFSLLFLNIPNNPNHFTNWYFVTSHFFTLGLAVVQPLSEQKNTGMKSVYRRQTSYMTSNCKTSNQSN